jgi:hypothetical protein
MKKRNMFYTVCKVHIKSLLINLDYGPLSCSETFRTLCLNFRKEATFESVVPLKLHKFLQKQGATIHKAQKFLKLTFMSDILQKQD